jgi:ribosomal protein S18 acetylase RimI-like enzyme
MFALRAASPDDVEAVLAFWLDATAEPSTTDDTGGIAALLERSPGSLILAMEDDVIVGSVVAGWDGWRGTIYRLAVAPSRRRNGIASALVAAAEQQLRDHGVRRTHLIVSIAGGASAEAFWKAAGYAPTDQVRMVKNLA